MMRIRIYGLLLTVLPTVGLFTDPSGFVPLGMKVMGTVLGMPMGFLLLYLDAQIRAEKKEAKEISEV